MQRTQVVGDCTWISKYVPRYVELMKVPTIAAYGDDYPHAKFYIACLEDATSVDLKAQEVPIEAIDSGKTSFTNINFPDNFFDVVISGIPIYYKFMIGACTLWCRKQSIQLYSPSAIAF